MPTTLPEPWLSFLKELDPIAGEPTKVPCFGGFAITQHYGLARSTVDIDVLDLAPFGGEEPLIGGWRQGRAARSKAPGVPRLRGNRAGPL